MRLQRPPTPSSSRSMIFVRSSGPTEPIISSHLTWISWPPKACGSTAPIAWSPRVAPLGPACSPACDRPPPGSFLTPPGRTRRHRGPKPSIPIPKIMATEPVHSARSSMPRPTMPPDGPTRRGAPDGITISCRPTSPAPHKNSGGRPRNPRRCPTTPTVMASWRTTRSNGYRNWRPTPINPSSLR